MTLSRDRSGSASAARIESVVFGAVVRLNSKPKRLLPRTIRRSSSAPAWVGQKWHSSGLDAQMVGDQAEHKALPGRPDPRVAREVEQSLQAQQAVKQTRIRERVTEIRAARVGDRTRT